MWIFWIDFLVLFYLFFLAPPALKLSTNETYVVDPGQDVTMSCEVTAGFPAPTVTWARYAGPLPRRAIIRGGFLTLRAITPADSGFYNCTAVNNVGNPARRNVNLVVRCKYVLQWLLGCVWFMLNSCNCVDMCRICRIIELLRVYHTLLDFLVIYMCVCGTVLIGNKNSICWVRHLCFLRCWGKFSVYLTFIGHFYLKIIPSVLSNKSMFVN